MARRQTSEDTGMPRYQGIHQDNDDEDDNQNQNQVAPPPPDDDVQNQEIENITRDSMSDRSSEHSASTGASGTTATGIMAVGPKCLRIIPFEAQVVTALMVPVCFLVAYSMILLVDYQSDASYIEERKPVIFAMVKFDREISLERVFVGRYLQYNKSTGNESYYAYRWWEYQKEWAPTDVKWNLFQEQLIAIARHDPQIHERTIKLVNQIQQLSITREAVRHYLTTGPQARRVYSKVYEHSMGVLIGMTQNPEVGGAFRDVQILVNGRRYVQAVDSLRGCLAEFVALHPWNNPTPAMRDELYFVLLAEQQMRRLYLESFRDGEILGQMFRDLVVNSQAMAKFNVLKNSIVSGFRNVTHEDLFKTSDELVLAVDQVMMYQVNEAFGKEPQQLAVDEALKMTFAVIPSILATMFIVYWQMKIAQNMTNQKGAQTRMNELVSTFVPKAFLRTMGARTLAQAAPGQNAEVATTMVFSDIRNFTQMCDGMTNPQIFYWLQMYFGLMTRVTDFHKGTIDKFIGDAIFAFFSVPADGLKNSIEWQSVAAFLNTQLGNQNMIQIGVGLHHGLCVFGVFGDDARRTCTLISPEVNFASRLDGLTKMYRVKILASESIIERVDVNNFVTTGGLNESLEAGNQVDSGLAYRFVGVVTVKGSQKTANIYEVFQADEVHLKRYKQDSKEMFEEAVRLRHQDCGDSAIGSSYNGSETKSEKSLSFGEMPGSINENEMKPPISNAVLRSPVAGLHALSPLGEPEEVEEDIPAPGLTSLSGPSLSGPTLPLTTTTLLTKSKQDIPDSLRRAFALWDKCEKMAKEREVTDTVIPIKRRHALQHQVDQFDEK